MGITTYFFSCNCCRCSAVKRGNCVVVAAVAAVAAVFAVAAVVDAGEDEKRGEIVVLLLNDVQLSFETVGALHFRP